MATAYPCPIKHSLNADPPGARKLIIAADLASPDEPRSGVGAGIEEQEGVECRIVLPPKADVAADVATRPAPHGRRTLAVNRTGSRHRGKVHSRSASPHGEHHCGSKE